MTLGIIKILLTIITQVARLFAISFIPSIITARLTYPMSTSIIASLCVLAITWIVYSKHFKLFPGYWNCNIYSRYMCKIFTSTKLPPNS